MSPFARRSTATAAALLALSACTSPAVVPGVSADDLRGHYFTFPQANGNRVLDGTVKGTFPNNIQTYDVNLPADVTWAVASHHPVAGFKYVVTTTENKAYVVHPSTKSGAPATMEELVDFQASGDQPPLIRHQGLNELPVIVTLPPQTAKVSPLSHPVPAGDGVYAFIDEDGDLVIWNLAQSAEIGRMAGIGALPDARIVRSTNDHMRPWLAFYAGATEYKSSCKLGDCVEGGRMLVVRVHPDTGTVDTLADVQLPAGSVFEGMSPMFLPDDTIIATVSDTENGSSLVKYNWEGEEVSSTPASRAWRHQLFYNDFGTAQNPLPLMVDLRAPHGKQFLQFFDIAFAPIWSMFAKISPYNTQEEGSRVVDTAVSGDLNGDGLAEAVVPTENMDHLAGVQLTDQGDGVYVPEEMWRLELPGALTSNVAAVAASDGSGVGIAMGAAAGKVFRLWVPLLADGNDAAADVPSGNANSPAPTFFPTREQGGAADTPQQGQQQQTVPAPTFFPTREQGGAADTPQQGQQQQAATKEPTWVPTKEPTWVPTKEPTWVPTKEPTWVPTKEEVTPPKNPPTKAAAQPVASPTISDFDKDLAMEEEMQQQFEEFESGLVREEEAQSRRQAALLGSILGVSVVLVGLVAVVFGRRRSSRKEMDSATMVQTSFNKHGVLDGMNDLELAADADMHANEEEEEADEDMLSVNLDRNGVI